MKILKTGEYIGEKLGIKPVSKERLGKYIRKEYEDAGLADEQAKEFNRNSHTTRLQNATIRNIPFS